jgi:hypothetical protein
LKLQGAFATNWAVSRLLCHPSLAAVFVASALSSQAMVSVTSYRRILLVLAWKRCWSSSTRCRAQSRCRSSCEAPLRGGMVEAAVVRDLHSPLAVSSHLPSSSRAHLSRSRRPVCRVEEEGAPLCRVMARLGFPSTPSCSFPGPPTSPLALYTAVPAAAAIRREPSRSRMWDGSWWGCGVRCASRCGQGPPSRSAGPPFRCSVDYDISTIRANCPYSFWAPTWPSK